MQKVYDFFDNKERLQKIAERLLREIPDAYVIGGYVRMLVHKDKKTHDIDIVVPDSSSLEFARYLLVTKFGCKLVDTNGVQRLYENFNPSPATYSRFTCPKNVTVDVVTKAELEKTPTPSSAHHASFSLKDGLQFGAATDAERMFRNKEFMCFTLGSVSCDKLDREGWKRV